VSGNVPVLAGLRALVVDDHEDTRDIYAQALTHAGAAVRVALSARDACAALDEVDVIITDYAMREGSGLWLLAQVQQRARPVPVIAVTGVAAGDDPQLGAASFARVLHKPVDPWVLCAIVREVTGAG
jgi:CheY-like chemotaxis protein